MANELINEASTKMTAAIEQKNIGLFSDCAKRAEAPEIIP